MNLVERVNKTYLDLYRDDEADAVNSLALIEYELNKSGFDELVLEFHDWDFQQQNYSRTKDWYKDLCFDLLRRSARFDFDCFGALYEYIGMNPDNPFFLTLVETAIHFSSYNAVDFLMSQLPNPNYPVRECGITFYTQTLAMGNPQVASYLLDNYPVNEDGLHSVEDELWADYTDVLATCDESSILVSIMLSPYLNSNHEKLQMLNVAIQNGASVYGHSPAEFPSILSPLSIASELSTEFLDFLLALNVIPEASNLFAAVSSRYTSFEEKKDILELLSVATEIDLNDAVSKEGHSLVEQAIISNCRDVGDLIDWLILQDDYNYNSSDFTYLITLAHKHHNFDIRDHILITHGGSESVYTKLLIDEENVWKNAEM